MEVLLSSDLEDKLNHLAAEQGRDAASLVSEAVERLVDYGAWFLAQVGEGISAADRGDLVDHEDVLKLIANPSLR